MVVFECLCVAFAKKNKASASLGSGFSVEAWQETGFSWGEGWWKGGRVTHHVLPEKKQDLDTEQPSPLLIARPSRCDG